jgi:hypothetical protein
MKHTGCGGGGLWGSRQSNTDDKRKDEAVQDAVELNSSGESDTQQMKSLVLKRNKSMKKQRSRPF